MTLATRAYARWKRTLRSSGGATVEARPDRGRVRPPYTSQPYNPVRDSARAYCRVHGLVLDVLPKERSWYYPERTFLLVFRRDPTRRLGGSRLRPVRSEAEPSE